MGHIALNPDSETWTKTGRNILEVSLLKLDVWDAAMHEAESLLASGGELDTMVVDSALNLLLFSPSYEKVEVEKFESLLSWDKRRTYLIRVSIGPFRGDIERWKERLIALCLPEWKDL